MRYCVPKPLEDCSKTANKVRLVLPRRCGHVSHTLATPWGQAQRLALCPSPPLTLLLCESFQLAPPSQDCKHCILYFEANDPLGTCKSTKSVDKYCISLPGATIQISTQEGNAGKKHWKVRARELSCPRRSAGAGRSL
jgi:hypothetical protein